MDGLGLAFAVGVGIAIVVIYFGVCLAIFAAVEFIAGRANGRAAERFAERHEIDGSITSIADYVAEQERRADRGRFRHATRFNEKSGPRRANDRAA